MNARHTAPPASGPRGCLARAIRAFKTRIDAQEFAWLPPWHRGRGERERAVRRLRAAALRLIRAQPPDQNPSPPGLLRCLAWPALLPVKAWQAARIPGHPGFFPRFLRGALDLALYNLRPEDLRVLRHLRPRDRRLASLYVTDLENQALLIHLNRHAPSRDLGDKIVFADFCRRHSLPHLPLIAHGGDGASTVLSPWPRADLFVKPTNLYGGQGARMLDYQPGSDTWRDEQGRLLSAGELLPWAAATYGRQPWLIQPRLHVDPASACWSSRALVTARITTALVSPGDQPRIILAYLRMPVAGMVVDNFCSGGLLSDIDHDSGLLSPALTKYATHLWYDRHPDTGAPIAGAAVPGWAAMRRLAFAAHLAAPDLPVIGWDIACRQDEAPVLMEANPVINIHPMGLLGETCWLETMLHREASLAPDTARPASGQP